MSGKGIEERRARQCRRLEREKARDSLESIWKRRAREFGRYGGSGLYNEILTSGYRDGILAVMAALQVSQFGCPQFY